jgi:DNA-binding NtrC family response regulator
MNPTKVLLIDDEEDYCMLMKNFFLTKKCEVQIAHSITNGLKLIENYMPNILFLDNNLPDGKGWMHVDYILKKNPTLHVHLVSAYNPDTNYITAINKVKIWEKPISVENLSYILLLFNNN